MSLVLSIFWLLVALALIVVALTAILNTLTFPRLGRHTTRHDQPRVAVLIPARNESAVIGDTVRRLLAQRDVDFTLTILDDNSTDGTTDLALAAAAGDPRVRVIAGQPLPAGWLGKNWACHQLAMQAGAGILVFTDADVRWAPTGLRAVLAAMQHYRADTLTVWPTQLTHTWAERLIVPTVALAIFGYLPELAVRLFPWPAFAAANGQALAFTRASYQATGGHAAVRDNIIEDVALARATKQAGLRLVMTDGAGEVACRMYHDWPSVRDGFAKNILAGHNNSPAFLLVSTVFHWSVFIVPWLWLALGGLLPLGPGWPVAPLALAGLGLGIRLLSAAATRQRLLDGLAMPLSVALMTIIAARSLRWHWGGGPQWKGRNYAKPEVQA